MKSLRQRLADAEKKEKELIESKNQLVMSMAHDLRTPLTGLIAFTEIVKLEAAKGEIDENHINKIISKANEIKELTNQIFDFAMLNNSSQVIMGEAEAFQSAFEDYLSDFCTVITSNGFNIVTNELFWPDCYVAINTNLIGRIFNNLISNIYKYGKPDSVVLIKTKQLEKFVSIEIINEIEPNKRALDSTGVGLKNIEMMMKEMGGKFTATTINLYFTAMLLFPIK